MRFLSGCCFLITLAAIGWIGVGIVHNSMTPPQRITMVGDQYIYPTLAPGKEFSPETLAQLKVIPGSITVSPADPTPLSLFLITGIPTTIVGFILTLFFFALAEGEMHHQELLALQYQQNTRSFNNQRGVSYRQEVQSPYHDEWDQDERNPIPPKRFKDR